MAKPVETPNWATDANFPAGANPWNGTPTKVDPAAPKKAEGWEPKEKPPAQTMNWWQNCVYLWCSWLNGLWDGAGNLTLDNNASVKVQGTGSYKHGTKTIQVAGPDFQMSTAVAPAYSANLGLSATPLNAIASVTLPIGKRVIAVRFYIKDNAAGPTKLQGFLSNSDHAGGGGALANTAQSSGLAANQTLTTGAIAVTIAAGNKYFLVIQTMAGAANTNIYGAEIDIDDL